MTSERTTMMPAPRYTIGWNNCNAERWEQLYANAPGCTALQQSYGYGMMAEMSGARITRAILSQDDTPIALWQATQKRLWGIYHITLGMRGPVWLKTLSLEEKQHALNTLKQELPSNWRRHTLFMPEEPEGFSPPPNLHRVMTGYSTIILDLRQEEDALLKAQDGKWRNRLRAAQKAELRTDLIGKKPENYTWLLTEETEQRKHIGYQALAPNMVKAYQHCVGQEGVMGLQAWSANERVAGVLFLRHGKSATYHIGWANETGKKANAHNLLLWEAIKHLKAGGTEWLDLGGVNDEDSPGLTHFKRGAGGELVTLCGTYR